MSFLGVGINILLSFPLLWINGILGKWKLHSYSVFGYSEFGFEEISDDNFADNFFQMIVHPAVYLAVVCWVLQLFSLEKIVCDLWLLIPFYWVLRIVHALFWDTFAFINWRTQIVTFLLSLLLGEGTLFCIILPLIDSSASIFIEVEAFRDAFWYAALAYIAKFIWDLVKGHLVGEDIFPSDKKTEVIVRRYNKYHGKYDEYIQHILNKGYHFKSDKQKEHFLCLLYAIMIYETHNRPLWARVMEYSVKLFCPNRTMSLGIMQIQTNNWLGNRMSINRAIAKLYAVFSASNISSKIEDSIRDYNPSDRYYEQVGSIYDELCKYLNLLALGHHSVTVFKRNVSRLK